MAAGTLTIRERVQAASRGARGLRRADRAAAVVITLGGIGIVASVIGILVFVLAEAWPLFRPPAAREQSGVASSAAAPVRALATGADEYQLYAYQLRPEGKLAFLRLTDGTVARELDVPGLEGVELVAGSRTLVGDLVAAAAADGRVSLLRVAFQPVYVNQRLSDVEIAVEPRGQVRFDTGGGAVRQVSYAESSDGQKAVAALVGERGIAVWRSTGEELEERATLETESTVVVTHIRLGGAGRLIAGTSRGNVYHWELGSPPRLTSVSPVGATPVTALEWILGDVTFVAGTEAGELSAWFQTRVDDDDVELAMVRAHQFEPAPGPVVALAASSRDKTFAAASADGGLTLRYLTSERTLLRLQDEQAPGQLLLTPRRDGLVSVRPDGSLRRYALDVPHPEITWRALFGQLWYEGYAKPDYVWQSTGATSDFEPKFSLVPLVFGTLKGTFYALLFAIPLAVLGALYTSQFVHPGVRAKVKPTLEIMAALPSVVIGFVAGLWLASVVETHAVGVLLMMVTLPVMGTAGVLVWAGLPRVALRRIKPGMEVALILVLLLAAGWLSLRLGPAVEWALFGGDFKLWLSTHLGLTYDQRNSLVVGLAMGFAVIPIIFTIADDAFSSVPSSLTAASLAMGASRWQTAMRVVLPTASPGVFSAVMIGFGRAVGETMIVLMATGNTPVLDWSMFNGMRTLSANIAVEIPEAPHGGTLYRVLFLSSALLFGMTFLLNTAAEVIRQRLRERYRAL